MILSLLLLVVFTGVAAASGTTPNLQQIVIGRCFEYVTLVDPSSGHDCEEIWRVFKAAVVRRSVCGVRVRDYHGMFRASTQSLPCGKLLFWSKTRELMHSYTAVRRHFWTLEDTLVGFMFNDLVWCGQQGGGGAYDFDYQSCPEWSACQHHPVYSLWTRASQNFAAAACGNITVLLNGSILHAFNHSSMFGSVELDNLNPRMVSYVHIKIAYNLHGPLVESCTQGSILHLIQLLQSRGFYWTCSENDL